MLNVVLSVGVYVGLVAALGAVLGWLGSTLCEVTVDGEPIHLTTKEFDLLAHMAGSPGRIFTRDQLLARIWGYDYVGDGRTVDVHVSWLRGKLRGHGGHDHFRTVRGVGYAFSPEPT